MSGMSGPARLALHARNYSVDTQHMAVNVVGNRYILCLCDRPTAANACLQLIVGGAP